MCGHGNPHEVSPKYLYNVCVAMVTLEVSPKYLYNVCVAMVTLMKFPLNIFIMYVWPW